MADFARPSHAREVAEHTTFQAFVNCYLREVNPGQWLCPEEAQRRDLLPEEPLPGQSVLQLHLPRQELTLWLLVSYRSRVGRHRIDAVYCWHATFQHETALKRESFWGTILLLVKELFHERGGQAGSGLKHRQLELTHRLTDSLQNTIRYLEARWPSPYRRPEHFNDAEQCLLFGHWLHPTPKSRQGILDWQHEMVTPEQQGQFQMHYFAVDRKRVEQQSLCDEPAEALVAETLKACDQSVALDAHEVLIPTHPLQAHWLLAQPHVQSWMESGELRYLGPLGHNFSATSSVRTVYHPAAPWMYKVSLPVKITNSLRQNKVHELRAGVLMARLMQTLRFSERFPQFQIIADPAYLTVKHPSGEESGFETILRDNRFDANAGRHVYCMAALLQDPWHPQQKHSVLAELLHTQAARENRTAKAVGLSWFEAYWRCAVEPCLVLFDHHGIALEAHQQNSLLRLSEVYPDTYYYRDNQGFYLDVNQRDKLLQWLPSLSADSELFYPAESIMDRFGYYLLVNQVFAVIHRMGVDGIVEEATLIERLRSKLDALRLTLSGSGRALIERWLTQTELPAKANLITRVEDIDELEADLELAAYGTIDNPLCKRESTPPEVSEAAYV